MRYNLLGRTGLLVSELCLGTMTFGGKGFWQVIGKQGQDEVNTLISRSMDAGINFIDTANVYAEGQSEELLGHALKGKRHDLIVATKVRGRMGKGVNQVGLTCGHIMQAVEDSLRRLQTDFIDLYQIHGFDAVTPLDDTIRTLDMLVQSGKVRYIACSNLAAWQMMKANGISERHGWSRFESVQALYTLAHRELEREIVPLVEDQQMGVLVWSPLAGGFLSGKFSRENEQNPEGARRSNFDFPPINRERVFDILDVLRDVASEQSVSVAQIALAWLLHQKIVTSIIIGAKTIEQLDDNLASVQVKLSDDQLKRLNDISAPLPEYPAWMIQRQSSERLPS